MLMLRLRAWRDRALFLAAYAVILASVIFLRPPAPAEDSSARTGTHFSEAASPGGAARYASERVE